MSALQRAVLALAGIVGIGVVLAAAYLVLAQDPASGARSGS